MGVVENTTEASGKLRARGRGTRRAIPAPAIAAAAVNGRPAGATAIRPPKFPRRVVDIRAHGAVADGRIDCSIAIADAIAACAKAGGGQVLVPAGTWLTGAIHLRSNINLHLEDGATLRFSSD